MQKEYLTTDLGKYLNKITDKGMKQFCEETILNYGSEQKLKTANKVASVCLGLLKKKKLLSTQYANALCDIMIVASLLHNVWYDGSVTSLFRAREECLETAKELIDPRYVEQIFQTIESQLGDDTPVEKCRPTPSTPIELFSWAVWFVEEYKDE